MRILSLDLDVNDDSGLPPGRMERLTDLVVLAGANGAGKSRILRAVRTILSDSALTRQGQASLETYIRAYHLDPKSWSVQEFAGWTRSLARAKKVTLDQDLIPNQVLDFFPKNSELADHRGMNELHQASAYQQVSSLGMEGMHQAVLPYIAQVLRRWFNSTHPSVEATPDEKAEATRAHEELSALIEQFLGVRPGIDQNQQPTLFGRPIPEASLSQGQCMLLQLAVALHAQGSKLDGLVLVLDEPECHLHPAAVIEFVSQLRRQNKLGQLWIATHCIPLLATVPPASIWYVHRGVASWAGRRPELVLESLLGGAQGRDRLEDFLRLPAQFACVRFAAECLVPPHAVETGNDDPQARQLREFCQAESVIADAPLRILDYGAGVGRLISALSERWDQAKSFREAVDYRAFEPDESCTEQLLAAVGTYYDSNGVRRVFSRTDDLSTLDSHSFDVIVMCNVLHEISPDKWVQLLGRDGLIPMLLAPNGKLLILEDTEIPHGEMAHRNGFLLLDNPHLRKLLRCTETDPNIQTVTESTKRLKVHIVPCTVLGKVDSSSILDALSLLEQTARDEIIKLRGQVASYRNGQLHALWTQLLSNAYLALVEHGYRIRPPNSALHLTG